MNKVCSDGMILSTPTVCSVEGCKDPVHELGYCCRHYTRWRKYRDVTKTKYPSRDGSDEKPGSWRFVTDGHGVHSRLRNLWGPASAYACVLCTNQAKDWAYDGTDSSQLLGSAGSNGVGKLWYSLYPEFYMPLCRRCHRRHDGAALTAEMNEYRTLKWELKLTGSEIREKLGLPT